MKRILLLLFLMGCLPLGKVGEYAAKGADQQTGVTFSLTPSLVYNPITDLCTDAQTGVKFRFDAESGYCDIPDEGVTYSFGIGMITTTGNPSFTVAKTKSSCGKASLYKTVCSVCENKDNQPPLKGDGWCCKGKLGSASCTNECVFNEYTCDGESVVCKKKEDGLSCGPRLFFGGRNNVCKNGECVVKLDVGKACIANFECNTNACNQKCLTVTLIRLGQGWQSVYIPTDTAKSLGDIEMYDIRGSVQALAGKKGYLLHIPQGAQIRLEGDLIPIPIPLIKGWNIFGVADATLAKEINVKIAGVTYTWENAITKGLVGKNLYTVTDSQLVSLSAKDALLSMGKGYYIDVSADMELIPPEKVINRVW